MKWQNLRHLMSKIFKVKKHISPLIMKEVFNFKKNHYYNLRIGETLKRKNGKWTSYGTESISVISAKVRELAPFELKNIRNKNKEVDSRQVLLPSCRLLLRLFPFPPQIRLCCLWNWSGCTKLALSASWTHGLIAQSVRASERNSVVVGSNPTQANFL